MRNWIGDGAPPFDDGHKPPWRRCVFAGARSRCATPMNHKHPIRSVLCAVGWLVLTAAIGSVGSSGLKAAESHVLFNGKSLAGWTTPAGDWQAAAAVSVDAQDSKKFSIQSGEGVLVNGARGRTKNILST